MEILSFDIKGKFAHFRKYYANNTAMTFSLPPRTTIIGIIAAALGIDKDSYYKDFDSDHLRITVNILTGIKKTFHRLNLLMIKSASDFRGKKGRIQTPFEIVSPIDPKYGFVAYRIFIAPTENGADIFKKIKTTFINGNISYNLTLGTANFSAHIENVHLYQEQNIKRIDAKNEFVKIDSACLSSTIEEISFEKQEAYTYNMIEEELTPADFVDNHNRELKKLNRILFTTGDIPLTVKTNSALYRIMNNKQSQTIQFLD